MVYDDRRVVPAIIRKDAAAILGPAADGDARRCRGRHRRSWWRRARASVAWTWSAGVVGTTSWAGDTCGSIYSSVATRATLFGNDVGIAALKRGGGRWSSVSIDQDKD